MSYSKELEDLIDHHFIANEELVKNKQMGGVGYLLNGNMCFGIYEDLLILRVGNVLARSLSQKPGIEPFKQNGDEQGGFIAVKPGIYSHQKILHRFLDKGLECTAMLPAKVHTEGESIQKTP